MAKNLEELALNKRRAYQKEWRARNKDKVKNYNTKYWENKAKKEIAQEE